ncbi:hypothetical protein [Streptomyces sp. NPDC023838]|uniref:hypothetical protein n=1 Tax=Streptomyces sp. NPDC023838 TaxID=3154325 RepID=UPI0033FCA140
MFSGVGNPETENLGCKRGLWFGFRPHSTARNLNQGKEGKEMKLAIEIVEDASTLAHHPGQ